MARRRRQSKFKLNGVRTYIDAVSRATSAKAAETIVYDLKRNGPYYSGEFEEAWVVKAGDKRIDATKPSQLTEEERRDDSLPFPRRVSPVDIPTLPKGAKSEYSIGNEMVYRNIAMDLVPGRWDARQAQHRSEKDWFIKYVQGGGLQGALEEATGKTANDPKIKGYRGVAKGKSSF